VLADDTLHNACLAAHTSTILGKWVHTLQKQLTDVDAEIIATPARETGGAPA
jgi:hypothetical protein